MGKFCAYLGVGPMKKKPFEEAGQSVSLIAKFLLSLFNDRGPKK